MHPISLTKLPLIDTHHLDILYRGFATEPYCELGKGAHGTRKGHALKSGTAYFVEMPGGIKQLGPECAKRLGKQKLHEVPDYTREAVSAHVSETDALIKSGNLIEAPIQFDPVRLEQEARARDIAYLTLRGEIIPGFKARERNRRNIAPLKNDDQDRPLIRLLQEFKKDPAMELGEVRRIREYAEDGDPKNSETRLLRLFLAQSQVEACLKRRPSSADSHDLKDWDKTLAETRALDSDSLRRLNDLTRQHMPNMPHSKIDGLPEIVSQATLFTLAPRPIQADQTPRTYRYG